MQNTIIAYFAVLVLMVIAALFLTGVIGGKHATATTTVVSTTSVQGPGGGQTSTVTQTTSSLPYVTCLSKNPTTPIFNGNFSTGTWAGWNTTGSGFGKTPFNITKANSNSNPNYTGYYGVPWNGWNGTFMATSFQTGVALAAGNITTLPFLDNQLYLNFKIISQNNNLLYVEILRGSNKPAIFVHYNTYASPPGVKNAQSTFVNASIPMGTLLCQNVSVRVVAGVTGQSFRGTNYIAVTGFYQSSTPAVNPTQPVNQTFLT